MSDTPLSKLLKQGSSLTSYNIGQVAKLEAQIATLTAELARVKAELAKEQSFVHALKGLHAGDIETLKAERDAALKKFHALKEVFYINMLRAFPKMSHEEIAKEINAAIAAREG